MIRLLKVKRDERGGVAGAKFRTPTRADRARFAWGMTVAGSNPMSLTSLVNVMTSHAGSN